MSRDDIYDTLVQMVVKPELEGSLPLSESTFLILLSLAPGPLHGYAILKEVAAMSQGRVRLSTGTLYGALKRLLAEGRIRRMDDEEPEGGAPTGGRRRTYYRLTDDGHRLLEAESARLQSLVAAARLFGADMPA